MNCLKIILLNLKFINRKDLIADNMNEKYCEGCATMANTTCSWFRKDMTCPCSICLVKMICVNVCSPLKKHTRIIYKIRDLKAKEELL